MRMDETKVIDLSVSVSGAHFALPAPEQKARKALLRASDTRFKEMALNCN